MNCILVVTAPKMVKITYASFPIKVVFQITNKYTIPIDNHIVWNTSYKTKFPSQCLFRFKIANK